MNAFRSGVVVKCQHSAHVAKTIANYNSNKKMFVRFFDMLGMIIWVKRVKKISKK